MFLKNLCASHQVRAIWIKVPTACMTLKCKHLLLFLSPYRVLKGTVSRDFLLLVLSKFAEIFASQGAPQISKTPAANKWNDENNIMQTANLSVNLKKKIYLYVNSTNQRCPNKIFKTLLIKDFFNLSPVSVTPVRWCTLSCEYLRKILKKFETALLGYSRGWGKLIHEKKNLKSIIP
jgi:hypothetical protein